MAQIINFPTPAPKFGYKRVRTRSRSAESPDQLHLLFQPTATILNFESGLGAFELALMLDERGDTRAAEKYLQAIDNQDCVADSYCNLGIIQSRQGNPAKAFDSFTTALKTEPRHFEAHFNLGNLYFDVDDYRLARVHYQFAAGIEPSFPNVYFNLALVEAVLGDFAAAMAALARYRQLASAEEAQKAEALLEALQRSLAAAKDSRVGSH